jgi:hypothetical protein
MRLILVLNPGKWGRKMRGTVMAGWAAAAILAGAAVQLMAQGGGPPIIQPHPKVPPAILLVLCDLGCTWRLDGVPQGHIDADGSAKAKVELGEHLVLATTDDGQDQVKEKINIKASGQTILDIALKPIRDARAGSTSLLVTCDLACTWSLDGDVKGTLDADGSTKAKVDVGQHKVIGVTADGLDKFSTTADAKAGTQTLVSIALKAVHDARVKPVPAPGVKPVPDPGVRPGADPAIAAGQVWVDSQSHLMWATKDNGKNSSWRQAADFCASLQTGGHSDWRLATIDELHTLYDPSVNIQGIGETGGPVTWHIKGNIRLTGWEWSQSQADAVGQAWGLSLITGKRLAGRVGDNIGNRALCVRRADN